MQKYKELYDLSREVFAEELNRSARLNEKATRYITVITFLLGVFAFFGKHILASILPPGNPLELLLTLVTAAVLVLLVITWFFAFRVLRVTWLRKIPIDADMFNNNRLIDAYYAYSRGIKEWWEFNRDKGDLKSCALNHAYDLIRVTVVLFVILCVLFTIHAWFD